MSDERHDIVLRPADDRDPPDLLRELLKSIEDLIPAAAEGGGGWLRGKGGQETAKAAEIRARVVTMIGQLQNERERLIQEREAARDKAEQVQTAEKNRHGERRYELETERLTAEAEALNKKAEALKNAVVAIKELHELGVVVDLSLVMGLLPVHGSDASRLAK